MMSISRWLFGVVLSVLCGGALAGAPTVESPLPLLSISAQGELTMQGDDFSFVPWRSDANMGKVHVLQYFAATQSASEIFKPFTDQIGTSFAPGTVHVTTILNLDAAMWGTSGFVISELKKNKRIHPQATMVVDEKGAGAVDWELGKEGAGLVVTDDKGIVKYFTRQAMNEQELASTLDLVRANIKQ
jgi:YtfJ family uncharacterized protein